MTSPTCPNEGRPGALACPVPRCRCCTPPLRDEIAVVLHQLFCDGRHDEAGGPCWTGWRPEADLMMVPVAHALARAWEDGARNGGRGLLPGKERRSRNPFGQTRRCPCYLHYHPPMDLRNAFPCICECEHPPCGHLTKVSGCGGCDPSAIEFEIPSKPGGHGGAANTAVPAPSDNPTPPASTTAEEA